MKVKTSELQGAALDWAVAKCEGWVAGTNDDDLVSFVLESSSDEMHFWPSTDWAQGGPIIEREQIALYLGGDDEWMADDGWKRATGPTPLVAAMRGYVAMKLGDEVEIPEELNQ
jgi:hypothetical protein